MTATAAAATAATSVAPLAVVVAAAAAAAAAAVATAVERRGRHGRHGTCGRRGRNSNSWNRRHLDKFDCNEIVIWGGRVDVILHMIYTPVIILIMYQKKRFVFQPKLEEFDRMFLGY